MDAYAALLSLMHTINNIHNHPRPPISLHQQQRHSLTENLTFLQDFLERYSNKEDEDLERRITSAAHAAEDVIETHIVDQIEASIRNSYQLEAGTTNEPILALMLHKFRQLLRAVVAPCKAGVSTGHDVENIISLDHFHVDLGRAIQELDLIKKEAMVIAKEKKMGTQHHDDHLHTNASTWQSSSTMIVQDEDFVFEVLDKLVGQHSNLQIIPIVGMGGIGKTTLALNIYSNQLIVEHFDIFAWVIVSQEYSGPHEILLQVLGQENRGIDDELGMRVHKKLWDRRYLIVMDDIWSSKPWDEVKTYFPDNNNGSRIMITTRKSNLAFKLSGSHIINHMNFLDEDKSWCLLCDVVFGRELCCPRELEDTGKKIARNCRGLPLSIVVIGGLLKKSNMTRVYWEYILQNLSPLINLEEDEYCLQILSRSYKELPVHLKPCFLYMGMFPEDEEINVSDLINLWVAEGIVKPIDGKILEEAAEEYLKELVDRNLILVHKLWWNGKAKSCRMHDLVRDLCIREAKKQRFFWLASEQDETREGINMERRICIKNTLPHISS